MKHNKKHEDATILYFYNELSDAERTDFQQHLKSCPDCQMRLEKLEKFGAACSKSVEMKPTEVLLNRLNRQIIEKIAAEPRTGTVRRLRNGWSDLTDSIFSAFMRPQYQFVTIGLTFVIGILVGKIWLSSGLKNDPAMLANFVNYQTTMTDAEKSDFQKAMANYMLSNGNVEIADLTQANNDIDGDGVVEVNLKVERDIALKGGLDDPTIQNMLRYSAIHDQSPERRMRAVKLLSQAVPSNEIDNTLIAVLLRDNAGDVRYRAMEALTKKAASEQVIEAFKSAALRDSVATIRKMAIEQLVAVGKDEIVPVLALVYSQEKDESVRVAAKEGLDALNQKNNRIGK
ncbi:MAG: HEAT repeat domain-containing protein [Candidatus Neomarinimicrobiota bacterium]